MPRLQRNRKQQKWRTPILIVAECELNNVAEILDRRNEVINEGKKRSDDTAAAMREPEPASAAHDLRESSLEPDPNPKRRLLMKSASSTASGSGEQSAKKPAADSESGMQTGEPLELGTGESTTLLGASSANTRRRIVVKSEPAAVTDQEAADGHRENAMRIASVEQVEQGNIMELSITGHVLKWARQSNLFGRLSLSKADGWNLKNHSHLTVASHLREKTHSSMMVVAFREERGICSAALKELLKIVKDQIQERSVVVIVLNKESAIWKDASIFVESTARDQQ